MAHSSTMISVDTQGFDFREIDFNTIASIVHVETGIHLTESKKTLVYSRLSKRLRILGIGRFKEYCEFVSSEKGREELHNMISALTTNVTSFYREKHHFDDFSARVLPELLRTARAGGKVRIWSAACSSGEEPYSIAFEILKNVPDAHRLDIKILATDIDPVILNKAEKGAYRESLTDKMPEGIRSRFFDTSADGETMTVKDEAKRLIKFRQLNLIKALPIKGPFDVIFCRNVTIYFDQPTREKVWSGIVNILDQSGQLYIGHSERISGPASTNLINNGVTAYKFSEK